MAAQLCCYQEARRSIRVWPIDSTNFESLWKGVGDFIHSALQVPEDDDCPDDIEEIVPLPGVPMGAGNLIDEALVTFLSAQKRDTLMSRAPNLSSYIDSTGRPTAGLWLEIPEALMDTIRLLAGMAPWSGPGKGKGPNATLSLTTTRPLYTSMLSYLETRPGPASP